MLSNIEVDIQVINDTNFEVNHLRLKLTQNIIFVEVFIEVIMHLWCGSHIPMSSDQLIRWRGEKGKRLENSIKKYLNGEDIKNILNKIVWTYVDKSK